MFRVIVSIFVTLLLLGVSFSIIFFLNSVIAELPKIVENSLIASILISLAIFIVNKAMERK